LDRPQLRGCGRFYRAVVADSAVIGDAMLEAENWKIALEHYEGHPISALLLAHQLMAIKQCLQRGKKGIPNAISGLDMAIDSSALFEILTQLHSLAW
jgi:hypothetical protein